MLALKALLAVFTAGAFVSCAVEPTAKQTNVQKVKYEDDENPHDWTKEKSEDAASSKPRVRQNTKTSDTNTNTAANSNANQPAGNDESANQQQTPVTPMEDQQEMEQEEDVAEEVEEVPAGPLVTLQAPAAAQSYTLLSQNTLTVPVTAVAAGTAVFSIDRSALDLVDLEQDISIAPALPTLSFAAAGEVKMLNIVVTITGKNPAVGAQNFKLIATTGQESTEVMIPFSVEQKVDITVANLDDPVGDTADQNLNWSSNGQTIEIKNGTMVTFTNMDPNNGLVVHMNRGFHGPVGNAFAQGESYVPGNGDICGESGDPTIIFYDHNNEGGVHAQTINCVDNQ